VSADLVKTIVSASGVSESVGKLAHLAIGARGTRTRFSARTMVGNPLPPGPPPAVSIETSADGTSWTTLVEPAVADEWGVETNAVFPLEHDLRVRWQFDEPCFETTYYWLRVWIG
jgi:hypothetical protein